MSSKIDTFMNEKVGPCIPLQIVFFMIVTSVVSELIMVLYYYIYGLKYDEDYEEDYFMIQSLATMHGYIAMGEIIAGSIWFYLIKVMCSSGHQTTAWMLGPFLAIFTKVFFKLILPSFF